MLMVIVDVQLRVRFWLFGLSLSSSLVGSQFLILIALMV